MPDWDIDELAEEVLRGIPQDQRQYAVSVLCDVMESIEALGTTPAHTHAEINPVDGRIQELATPAPRAAFNVDIFNMSVQVPSTACSPIQHTTDESQENADETTQVSPYCDQSMPDFQTLMTQTPTPPRDEGRADMRQCLWGECQDVIEVSIESIRDHLEEKHALPSDFRKSQWVFCGCKHTTRGRICEREMLVSSLPAHIYRVPGHYGM